MLWAMHMGTNSCYAVSLRSKHVNVPGANWFSRFTERLLRTLNVDLATNQLALVDDRDTREAVECHALLDDREGPYSGRSKCQEEAVIECVIPIRPRFAM